MEHLVLIGIIVVFIGIFLIILGSLLEASEGKTKFAVGGFIGPIPFGFASEKGMLYLVIAISLVLFVLFVLMSQKFV